MSQKSGEPHSPLYQPVESTEIVQTAVFDALFSTLLMQKEAGESLEQAIQHLSTFNFQSKTLKPIRQWLVNQPRYLQLLVDLVYDATRELDTRQLAGNILREFCHEAHEEDEDEDDDSNGNDGDDKSDTSDILNPEEVAFNALVEVTLLQLWPYAPVLLNSEAHEEDSVQWFLDTLHARKHSAAEHIAWLAINARRPRVLWPVLPDSTLHCIEAHHQLEDHEHRQIVSIQRCVRLLETQSEAHILEAIRNIGVIITQVQSARTFLLAQSITPITECIVNLLQRAVDMHMPPPHGFLALIISFAEFDEANPDILVANPIPLLVTLINTGSFQLQTEAANLLALLTREEGAQRDASNAGAVAALIPLLSIDDPGIQELAANCLSNLAHFEDNLKTMVTAGILPPLAHLLTSSNERVRMNAADTIANLAMLDENHQRIVEEKTVVPMVKMLSPHTLTDEKISVLAAFKNLATSIAGQRAIAKAHGVKALFYLLENESDMGFESCNGQVVEETLGTLANMTLSEQGQKVLVRNLGVPVVLRKLFQSTPPLTGMLLELVENMVQLVAASAEFVGNGLIPYLVKYLSSTPHADPSMVSASSAVVYLSIAEEPRLQLLQLEGIPMLANLLKSEVQLLRCNAAVALGNMALSTNVNLAIGSDSTVLQELIKMLNKSESPLEKATALNCISALAEAPQSLQLLIDSGVIPLVVQALSFHVSTEPSNTTGAAGTATECRFATGSKFASGADIPQYAALVIWNLAYNHPQQTNISLDQVAGPLLNIATNSTESMAHAAAVGALTMLGYFTDHAFPSTLSSESLVRSMVKELEDQINCAGRIIIGQTLKRLGREAGEEIQNLILHAVGGFEKLEIYARGEDARPVDVVHADRDDGGGAEID